MRGVSPEDKTEPLPRRPLRMVMSKQIRTPQAAAPGVAARSRHAARPNRVLRAHAEMRKVWAAYPAELAYPRALQPTQQSSGTPASTRRRDWKRSREAGVALLPSRTAGLLSGVFIERNLRKYWQQMCSAGALLDAREFGDLQSSLEHSQQARHCGRSFAFRTRAVGRQSDTNSQPQMDGPSGCSRGDSRGGSLGRMRQHLQAGAREHWRRRPCGSAHQVRGCCLQSQPHCKRADDHGRLLRRYSARDRSGRRQPVLPGAGLYRDVRIHAQ